MVAKYAEFPHSRTTLCTFYKHSQSQADLSWGIGDPHWESATGITQLDRGLSISLPQTLKLSAAHRPRVVCWYLCQCVIICDALESTCSVSPTNSAVAWFFVVRVAYRTQRPLRVHFSLPHSPSHTGKPQTAEIFHLPR